MAKNDENVIVFWAAGILIGFLYLNSQVQSSDKVGLQIHYYKDGEEVNPEKNLFATVVTPPGSIYNQISLEISIKSNSYGNLSNLKIVDASPPSFKNSLPTISKTLVAGESKILWNSSLLDVAQFESYSQPVRFFVNVSGYDEYTNQNFYGSGYTDLWIQRGYVIFRTNDLSYPAGGVIAVADACGDSLNNYSYSITSGAITQGNYDCKSLSFPTWQGCNNYPVKIADAPGNWSFDSAPIMPDTKVSVWKVPTGICLCELNTNHKINIKKYVPGGSISLSQDSINPPNEAICLI